MSARDWPKALRHLLEALESLPGIGERSAERIALHLLRIPEADAKDLAARILHVREALRACRVCCNLSETEVCEICSDSTRDFRAILVVEHPRDVLAFERSLRWRGLYHVLLGRVSPLEGAKPKDLTIARLLQRTAESEVREVVIATGMNAEGDATALLVGRALAGQGIKVTRLSRGLPSGFTIDYAGTEMLGDALLHRRPTEADNPEQE